MMKKTALILGGFGGVGYACASILSENGYNVVVVHRGRRAKAEENMHKVHELEKNGINVVEIKGNATAPECMEKVCNKLRGVRVYMTGFIAYKRHREVLKEPWRSSKTLMQKTSF